MAERDESARGKWQRIFETRNRSDRSADERLHIIRTYLKLCGSVLSVEEQTAIQREHDKIVDVLNHELASLRAYEESNRSVMSADSRYSLLKQYLMNYTCVMSKEEKTAISREHDEIAEFLNRRDAERAAMSRADKVAATPERSPMDKARADRVRAACAGFGWDEE